MRPYARRPLLRSASRIAPALWVVLTLLTLVVIAPASADVIYQYDALGRLIAVVDENGQVANYQYDAVGNLLSITRSSATQAPPQLDAIIPTQGETGTTVPVTITGQNLLGTQQVTTDNPGITVGTFSATNDRITTAVIIAPLARAGPTTVTVVTPFGSATIGFTVISSLHFDGIIATAATGTPADPTQASANFDQIITIRGRNLSAEVEFETPWLVNGVLQSSPVADFLINVNPEGTEAQIFVLSDSGTGLTRLRNANGPSPESHVLQIVPLINEVRPPFGGIYAPGQPINLDGWSFTADMRVRLPLTTGGSLDQSIIRESVSTSNREAQVVLPNEVALTGMIQAITPGGVSAPPPSGLTGLENPDGTLLRATVGVPADPALPSANQGQLVALRGWGLLARLVSVPRFVSGAPSGRANYVTKNVSFDQTRAEITLNPTSLSARPGTGQVFLTTYYGAVFLQIVPTFASVSVPSFAAGQTMTLAGTSFTADMKVRFPLGAGGTVDQPIVPGSVVADTGSSNDRGQVVIPDGAVRGPITVVTPGGESNAVTPP